MGFSVVILLWIVLSISVDATMKSTFTDHDSNNTTESVLQQRTRERCNIFLAPTPTMNWGVYANVDFQKGDIVDVAGLTIPMAVDSPAVERSVLQDYIYGYWRVTMSMEESKDNDRPPRPSIQQLYSVMLGYDMFYNHNATPNIEFQTFGREPFMMQEEDDHDNDDLAMNVQGFVALRNIQRGEELWSTYKSDNEHDGGVGWFQQRGIALKTVHVEDSQLSLSQIDEYSQQYCSKISATISSTTWQKRIMTLWPPQKHHRKEWMKDNPLLPAVSAGWGQARAKDDIGNGERIELSTALVMSYSKHIQGTALRPIAYAWHDLYPHHHQILRQLRERVQLAVQYQGPETQWQSIDGWGDVEDVVLFPAAGNIGMVSRKQTAHQPTNCKLVLLGPLPDFTADAKVTVSLELLATRDIVVGELLTIDLPVNKDNAATKPTPQELRLLSQELRRTGQLHDSGIFRTHLQYRLQQVKQDKQPQSSEL